ncbi:EF-hand domain-containing protein [Microcoleus sp. AR_TQ3_B6]|uniref:EF-hand domain-containing protein n=1 Tax=Microcoleus sp. AR_TQ3_B6 TaxID=3055284 RepID=UPI002FD0CAE1
MAGTTFEILGQSETRTQVLCPRSLPNNLKAARENSRQPFAQVRSLPSLVPVVLHTVASPEEHRQRFRLAKETIASFRQQLRAALQGQQRNILFEQANPAIKGDLRYIFDAIDRDRSRFLSTQDFATHLHQAGKVLSEGELTYLFNCMDRNGSSAIDFEEFGELMLRHQQLMSRYTEFVTYFLPIDVDADDIISLH